MLLIKDKTFADSIRTTFLFDPLNHSRFVITSSIVTT